MIKNKEKILNIENYEKSCFYLGVFLLSTAPAISVLLFIFAIIKSTNNKFSLFLKDKFNILLLVVSILMITSCFFQYFLEIPYPIEFNNSSTWIGLINWIPLFWCFWAFQPYLKSHIERKKTILFLISGTIPIIISGLAQYWFDVNGPWELFKGMIVWYQRPIEITDGLTGPFNNANYAGAWLAMAWPFSLSIYKTEKTKKKKFISLFIIILFVISIIFTNSRNAWIGLMLSIPIIMGRRIAIFTFILVTILLFIIFLTYSSLLSADIKEFIFSNLPHNFMSNFPEEFTQLENEFPRIGIWKTSIEFILIRPLTGWGAASFPLLYELQNNNWIGHPHNLLLEIAFSYGIIPSLILSFFVISIFIKSTIIKLKKFKKSSFFYESNYEFDKAWLCSTLFLIIAHLIDIQYFDLRISIISWILLAGLRSMILEEMNTI